MQAAGCSPAHPAALTAPPLSPGRAGLQLQCRWSLLGAQLEKRLCAVVCAACPPGNGPELGCRGSTRRRPELSPPRGEPRQVVPGARHVSQAGSAASSDAHSLLCPPRTRSSLQCGSTPTHYCKRYFHLSCETHNCWSLPVITPLRKQITLFTPFLLSKHQQPLCPFGDALQYHFVSLKSGYCHMLLLLFNLFLDNTFSP